jgi:hypothetical protein
MQLTRLHSLLLLLLLLLCQALPNLLCLHHA